MIFMKHFQTFQIDENDCFDLSCKP